MLVKPWLRNTSSAIHEDTNRIGGYEVRCVLCPAKSRLLIYGFGVALRGLLLFYTAARFLVPRLLLLSPLPLHQYRQKVPEVKLRPEALQKEDMGILVTLPEHEIAQSLNATSPDEDIERRTPSCVHMAVESFRCDGLWVWVNGYV